MVPSKGRPAQTPYEICKAGLQITDADRDSSDFDAILEKAEREHTAACDLVSKASDEYDRLFSILNINDLLASSRTAFEPIKNLKQNSHQIAKEIKDTQASISSAFTQTLVIWQRQIEELSNGALKAYQARVQIASKIDRIALSELIKLKVSGELHPNLIDEIEKIETSVKHLEDNRSHALELTATLQYLLDSKKQAFVRLVQNEISNYIGGRSKSLFDRFETIGFLVQADLAWGEVAVNAAIANHRNYGLYKTALTYLDHVESLAQNAKQRLSANSRPEIVDQIVMNLSNIAKVRSKILNDLSGKGPARTQSIKTALWADILKTCSANNPDIKILKEDLDQRIRDSKTLENLADSNPSLKDVSQINGEMIVIRLRQLKKRCAKETGGAT
jgi:hypothetical protein